MTSLLCPLHPSMLRHLTTPLDCDHLKAIEEHISSSSCPHPQVLKDLRFKEPIEGCSPLLLACHFGELTSVKHIVESWGADLREEAVYYTNPTSTTYYWDSARIGRATPLFVACIKGHITIVRYLIEKGADVSVKTSDVIEEKDYDGLTPLYATLWEIHDNSLPNMSKDFLKERSDIVRLLLESGASPSVKPANGWPIWMMPVCGIDAITELVNHGMDLNEGSESGTGSILFYWAGGSHKISKFSFYEKDCSLKVVKYLLDKDVRLLAHRDDWGFTAIIEAAYGGNVLRPNYTVLNYLLDRDDIDEMDKIDALELADAFALIGHRHQGDRPKTFKYWRQALRLRQNESNPKPKILMKFKNVRAIEWTTLDELERIIQNPSEYEIQSFLVRLRILISRKKSSRAVDILLYSYLWADSFSSLKSQKRYDDILDILWASLETINLLNGSQSIAVTVKTVMVMVITLVFLERAGLGSFESVKTSLYLILPHLKDWERFNIQNYMETMLLLSWLLSSQHQLHDEGKLESFFQLVRRERRDSKGRTLLFIACEDDKSIHLDKSIDLYATVCLLLEGKADPHLANIDGDTPLHVAASQSGELGDSIARLLLNSGAHLDRVNKCEKTAVQIWIEQNGSQHRSNEDIVDIVPDWSRGIVLKLSCLCAQVIRFHKIPFMTVPVTLHTFIKLH